MRQVILLPKAVRDIDDQTEYYENQGTPATAERWELYTAKTFNFLAANPNFGASILPGLRACWVEKFKQHLIVDRVQEVSVEIVRVIHGAADLDSIL